MPRQKSETPITEAADETVTQTFVAAPNWLANEETRALVRRAVEDYRTFKAGIGEGEALVEVIESLA